MDDMSLAEALRAAARDHKRRSKIGQLREVLDEIEAAKRAGLSNKTVVDILNERGLQIDLNNFQISLHRLRKERKARMASPLDNKAANGNNEPTQQQSPSLPSKADLIHQNEITGFGRPKIKPPKGE